MASGQSLLHWEARLAQPQCPDPAALGVTGGLKNILPRSLSNTEQEGAGLGILHWREELAARPLGMRSESDQRTEGESLQESV